LARHEVGHQGINRTPLIDQLGHPMGDRLRMVRILGSLTLKRIREFTIPFLLAAQFRHLTAFCVDRISVERQLAGRAALLLSRPLELRVGKQVKESL
jgi:hypothetical protein